MKLSGRLLLSALVALGALVCGVAWALSSPVGSSPDDTFHLTSIWCSAGDETNGDVDDQCEAVDDDVVRVPAMVGGPSCFAFNSQVSGECQKTITGDLTTLTINHGTYPGGFYRVMHVFKSESVGEAVVAMRVFNVLVAVLLFTALALSGTRATTRAQLYSLSVSLVPLGWFIIASTNPSSWAVIGVAAYGFALHSYLVVRRRWKLVANAILAVLGTVLAVSARGDAAVYVGVITVALGILHWRTLRSRPKLLVVPAICCLIAVYASLSAGQLAGVAGAAPETDRTRLEALAGLLVDFPVLISGSFGYGFGLGWLDTPVHAITAYVMAIIIGFTIFFGASRGSRSKAVAVLFLAGMLLAFPAWTLYRARLVPGQAVQPRYLLPVIPVLILMLQTGRKPWRSLRLGRVQAWSIWAMLTAAHASALYVNTRRYVTGLDDPIVMDHTEWWWPDIPSPYVVCILGSIGFAVLAATIIPFSRPRRPAPAVAAAPTAERTPQVASRSEV